MRKHVCIYNKVCWCGAPVDAECGKSNHSEAWPLLMDSLAVHPAQVEDMNARNKKHGINVVYEPKSGRALVPDANERRKLMKLERVYDKHAFM